MLSVQAPNGPAPAFGAYQGAASGLSIYSDELRGLRHSQRLSTDFRKAVGCGFTSRWGVTVPRRYGRSQRLACGRKEAAPEQASSPMNDPRTTFHFP
jgi:hypothetical protein